jgi:methylated-DNA-[protein]-cysteine S-methyltransferase
MFTRHAVIDTTLGDITLVATDDALVGIYFPQHWVGAERAALGEEARVSEDPLLAESATQLREYLAGERRSFDVVISAKGDEFQRRVWALLKEIPFGETTTYGDLAEQLGSRLLARKVGQAVGYNPLSIIIPCHRVVGKDGKLTGYAGGLTRKQFLLDLEEPATKKAGRLF